MRKQRQNNVHHYFFRAATATVFPILLRIDVSIYLIRADLSIQLVFCVIYFLDACLLSSHTVIILSLTDAAVNISLICAAVNITIVGTAVMICLVFIAYIGSLNCPAVIIISLIRFAVNILVCSIDKL